MQIAVISRKVGLFIETTIRLRVDGKLKAEIVFLEKESPNAKIIASYINILRIIHGHAQTRLQERSR